MSDESLETTGNGQGTEKGGTKRNKRLVSKTWKKSSTRGNSPTAETGVTTAKLIIQDLIFKFYNLSFLIRFKRDHDHYTATTPRLHHNWSFKVNDHIHAVIVAEHFRSKTHWNSTSEFILVSHILKFFLIDLGYWLPKEFYVRMP